MKPQNIFLNPKTRVDKAVMICWWAGMIVALSNVLPIKQGTPEDTMWQALILAGASLALFLPMSIVTHRRWKKASREMAHDLHRLETKLIVLETLYEILDPEGFNKVKEKMEVEKMFAAKTGPEEK